eukprot:1127607-Prorocentrum_minimum.AAC.4
MQQDDFGHKRAVLRIVKIPSHSRQIPNQLAAHLDEHPVWVRSFAENPQHQVRNILFGNTIIPDSYRLTRIHGTCNVSLTSTETFREFERCKGCRDPRGLFMVTLVVNGTMRTASLIGFFRSFLNSTPAQACKHDHHREATIREVKFNRATQPIAN